MAQFEEDAAMVGGGEMKTGKAAIAERKKKRREGQVRLTFNSPTEMIRIN